MESVITIKSGHINNGARRYGMEHLFCNCKQKDC